MTKTSIDVIVQKIEGLKELFEARFKSVEKHQAFQQSEVEATSKYNFRQDKRWKELETSIIQINQKLASFSGVKKTVIWASAIIMTISGAFISLSIKSIKTDSAAYIDTKIETIIDSQSFKKKVISIINTEFFKN